MSDNKKVQEETQYRSAAQNLYRALNLYATFSEEEMEYMYKITREYQDKYNPNRNSDDEYLNALYFIARTDNTHPAYKVAQKIIKDHDQAHMNDTYLKVNPENIENKDYKNKSTAGSYYGGEKIYIKNPKHSADFDPTWHERTIIHENKHRIDEKLGCTGFKLSDTRARANWLTERLAFTTECLYLAEKYQELKSADEKKYTYSDPDGREHDKKLKSMFKDKGLMNYPRVYDAIKDGFDPNNPQDVERVVNAAAKDWLLVKENYDNQAHRAGTGKNLTDNFDSVLHEEKVFEEVEERMLKTVYTGYRTYDLSAYKDVLSPENTKEAEKLFAKDDVLTTSKVKALNAYFEEKGLSDDEKEACFEKIKERYEARRDGDKSNKAEDEIMTGAYKILWPKEKWKAPAPENNTTEQQPEDGAQNQTEELTEQQPKDNTNEERAELADTLKTQQAEPVKETPNEKAKQMRFNMRVDDHSANAEVNAVAPKEETKEKPTKETSQATETLNLQQMQQNSR